MHANVLNFDSNLPKIVYLDSSFIIHFCAKGSKYHEPCAEFMRKLEKSNIPSVISNLTLDELWYSMIKIGLIEDFGIKWYVELRNNPKVINKYLPIIKRLMRDISLLQNVILVEVKTEMMLNSLNLIEKYSLLPRDAIHLSTMLGLGIKDIVTTDVDFTRVNKITVYTCNPAAF